MLFVSTRPPSWAVPLAVFIALTSTVLALILMATGGHFSYTLDDPYIHMALAERLAAGHYGINPSEASSPASSILWPFLLMIGAGTNWHPYLPLVLNIICGAATVIVIAKMVERLPWNADDRWAGLKQAIITTLFIFVGNLAPQAFNGMEHSLQLLIVSSCAFGIAEALANRRIPTWCVAAAAAGTAVRYEMIGPAVAMSFALAGQRRLSAAALVMFISLIIPIGFGIYLTELGLPFLPNSVLVKSGHLSLAQQHRTIDSLAEIAISSIRITLLRTSRWPFLVLFLTMGLISCVSPKTQRWALCGVTTALFGHLLFGSFDWFHRYEVYAILFGLLVLFATLKISLPQYIGSWIWPIPLMLVCAFPYIQCIKEVPIASQNIYEQQYQMHRFANEFYKKNVAINDLGWVAYRQQAPFYVLDLVGLGSNESLWASKNIAWLDNITTEKNIGLAMIYTDWFAAIPPTWTLVGQLKLSTPAVTAARSHVEFYATSIGNIPEIRNEIRSFAETLPPGVTMAMNE